MVVSQSDESGFVNPVSSTRFDQFGGSKAIWGIEGTFVSARASLRS
jgi:hypothetical protein